MGVRLMSRQKSLSRVAARKTRNGKQQQLPGAAEFLKNSNKTVIPALGTTIELADFRETSPVLSRDDRLRIVDQALVLFEQNYVHLPLKRAMHAVDPVQRLKLVEDSLLRATDASMAPELEFHRTMIEVFMSVRDLHTNYILPAP